MPQIKITISLKLLKDSTSSKLYFFLQLIIFYSTKKRQPEWIVFLSISTLVLFDIFGNSTVYRVFSTTTNH